MAGFLSKLFGGGDRSPEFRQVVFISAQARYKYLMQYLQQSHQNNTPVLLLAWFPKTLEDLEFLLQKLEMEYTVGFSAARIPQPRISMDLVENIQKTSGGREPMELEVLVAEHYPLYDKEQDLLRHIRSLSAGETTIVASMDEPVFELFGGERIRHLMEKMDMKPDEAIEHNMVRSAVQRAQQKLQKKVTQEKPATSQEEWVRQNYPEND